MYQHQLRCPQSQALAHPAAGIAAAHPEPRIQAAARLPAQVADEFGAEQATPDQTLRS